MIISCFSNYITHVIWYVIFWHHFVSQHFFSVLRNCLYYYPLNTCRERWIIISVSAYVSLHPPLSYVLLVWVWENVVTKRTGKPKQAAQREATSVRCSRSMLSSSRVLFTVTWPLTVLTIETRALILSLLRLSRSTYSPFTKK